MTVDIFISRTVSRFLRDFSTILRLIPLHPRNSVVATSNSRGCGRFISPRTVTEKSRKSLETVWLISQTVFVVKLFIMIFIAGASGFVGGHLIDALLKNGYKLRCLARSEKAEKALREKGIDVFSGDITIPETIEGALDGVDFVIHLVGIIEEKGSATFLKSVHVDGTKNLIAEAKRAGAKHFFYQSALGADKSSWSGYLRTKAEAEEIVASSGIPFTIFRPSLIIGKWDGFTKKAERPHKNISCYSHSR